MVEGENKSDTQKKLSLPPDLYSISVVQFFSTFLDNRLYSRFDRGHQTIREGFGAHVKLWALPQKLECIFQTIWQL